MGLLQRACETYDANQQWAGVYREGHEVLPPIGHILTAADIEITLDIDGHFIQAAAVAKDAPKTLIPVTEESMGRTSSPCAHPLCDTLAYISPQNVEKHSLYLDALDKWRDSHYGHPILHAVSKYVHANTIIRDLENAGLLPKKEEEPFIRWRVAGLPDSEEACWRNSSLHSLFADYQTEQTNDKNADICMISGVMSIPALQHIKGIASLHGNAKLISSNDKRGFTYRGRFNTETESVCVGYLASQKAHNALRWLIGEQKTYYGGKAFLCWNPHGIPVPSVTDPFGSVVETDILSDFDIYRDRLKRTLSGCRTSIPDDEAIIIAVFDAATTGRLSLNYYSEMASSDFLNRLHDWDEHCCWFFGKQGILSPKLLTIVSCAFGTERVGNGSVHLEVDERIKAQQLLRLVACRVNRAAMPSDIKDALLHRASTPMAYEPSIRRMILSTACAVIKKYDHDRKGVNWEMALKPDKPDLSYQYGRLLAVLEKAEMDTYEPGNNRETNAIRMQAVFVQRPQYATARILEQVKKAYFPRLKPSSKLYYERLIGDIYEMIDAFPEEEQNRSLQDSYLMGYYLQRNELWKPKVHGDEQNIREETENDFAEQN